MTNAAAIGYMILSAKRLKLKSETIKKLDVAMYHAMDSYTEAEAEEVYRNT